MSADVIDSILPPAVASTVYSSIGDAALLLLVAMALIVALLNGYKE
jgi:apolipoprotein N-acyltransferase